MAMFYSYAYPAMQLMTDWLIENGTGHDWSVSTGQMSDDPSDAFRNRAVHIWTFRDDNLAVMFKIIFSEYLFDTQLKLYDSFMAKRKTLGIV